jgi:Flp pilus assembly pilin Flp
MAVKMTFFRRCAGFTFIEYAVVLGIAAAVLAGMNTYIKRGIQGKLKDMTDHFISNEQVAEVDPIKSVSSSISHAEIDSDRFIDTGTRSRLFTASNTVSNKIEVVEEFFDPLSMVTVEEIEKDLPGTLTPPKLEDFTNVNWEAENRTEILVGYKDRLVREAESLEANVGTLYNQGNALVYSGYNMGCPRKKGKGECEAGRANMINQGNSIMAEAESMFAKAGELKEEAGKVQAKIYELKKGQ